MNVIFAQLGELVLGSIPTMVLFLLLVAAYSVLLHGPLHRTLALRRQQTIGAIEEAQAAIAAADRKAQEFEDRLRAARAEMGARRDKQVAEWTRQRDAAAEEAREAARARVAAAKGELEREGAQARERIGAGADALAEEIVRSLLPAGARG